MKTATPAGHAHHMVLETPNGTPTVQGTCKLCGYSRPYWAAEPDDTGRPELVLPGSTPKRTKPREWSLSSPNRSRNGRRSSDV